ncbi:hypothetical protein W97_05189 [Coniosporium apollinis CBS 100218]|uniref:Heterokaryon incompatibility domain-containing protein n=1 Tax=Coniosporium apollinis (strain CBS 100218) TaxID=1168221 RepID=R7YVM0_CONA1|nr:uncharacterized protein W97_05189 [Coniosporium apollinis CBS 100218]EON65947.1 hypothetical protein W97_05189 [Coniosporium apollinis CBS 100218]
MENFAITKRGWTFQESYIPPRLLIFGDQEPFLRCRTKDAMPIAITAIDYQRSRIEPRRNIDHALPPHIREQEHLPYNLRHIWMNVVVDYTRRQFSFEGDRPLAIRGIVDFLEKRGNGLPTWSWLSTPNEIAMSSLELLGDYRGDAVVEFSERDPFRLALECPVISFDDVEEEDQIEYWQDHEDEDKADGLAGAECYVLVLSKMSNDTVLGLATTQLRDLTHVRRGVIELRDAEKWLSKPKGKVIVM